MRVCKRGEKKPCEKLYLAADSDVMCWNGEVETDLVDSTKQRHKLAEQSGAQTGDVHEGTLTGGEETHVNVNRDAPDRTTTTTTTTA